MLHPSCQAAIVRHLPLVSRRRFVIGIAALREHDLHEPYTIDTLDIHGTNAERYLTVDGLVYFVKNLGFCTELTYPDGRMVSFGKRQLSIANLINYFLDRPGTRVRKVQFTEFCSIRALEVMPDWVPEMYFDQLQPEDFQEQLRARAEAGLHIGKLEIRGFSLNDYYEYPLDLTDIVADTVIAQTISRSIYIIDLHGYQPAISDDVRIEEVIQVARDDDDIRDVREHFSQVVERIMEAVEMMRSAEATRIGAYYKIVFDRDSRPYMDIIFKRSRLERHILETGFWKCRCEEWSYYLPMSEEKSIAVVSDWEIGKVEMVAAHYCREAVTPERVESDGDGDGEMMTRSSARRQEREKEREKAKLKRSQSGRHSESAKKPRT